MGLNKNTRVTFALDEALVARIVCYIPLREELDPEHLRELYYTREEFQAQRVAAKGDSRETVRTGISKKLDEVFSEKTKNAQVYLNEWSSKGQAARGLERWANREHGEKRQQEQFSAVMAVLQAQDDMMYSKCPVDSETLRRVSHKATRTARHFARMMGKADAFALNVDLKGDAETASLAGMSTLSIDSGSTQRFHYDDISLATSSSHDGTFSSSLLSLQSLDDEDLVDVDLPKKGKDGKRRFRFSLRKNKDKGSSATRSNIAVHSRG